MSKKTYTKKDFKQVLCDCKGYSEEEALELFNDYQGQLRDMVYDYGGNEDSVRDMDEFLSKSKKT